MRSVIVVGLAMIFCALPAQAEEQALDDTEEYHECGSANVAPRLCFW